MTLTYPIDMPTTGAKLQAFEPQRVDFISPTAGGRVGAVSAGTPLWSATWELGVIDRTRSDIWRAWLMRLRGSQRTFLARDIARPYPLANIGGFSGLTRPSGGAFDGSASTWSQSIGSEGDATVTLTGLPVGLVLSVGDYIGWRWDASGSSAGSNDRRSLARVVVGGTANGSGVLGVVIEPPVPTLVVPPTAIAHLDRPGCVMRLVPGQSEVGAVDRRLAITSAKIAGIQDLRP